MDENNELLLTSIKDFNVWFYKIQQDYQIDLVFGDGKYLIRGRGKDIGSLMKDLMESLMQLARTDITFYDMSLIYERLRDIL